MVPPHNPKPNELMMLQYIARDQQDVQNKLLNECFSAQIKIHMHILAAFKLLNECFFSGLSCDPVHWVFSSVFALWLYKMIQWVIFLVHCSFLHSSWILIVLLSSYSLVSPRTYANMSNTIWCTCKSNLSIFSSQSPRHYRTWPKVCQ